MGLQDVCALTQARVGGGGGGWVLLDYRERHTWVCAALCCCAEPAWVTTPSIPWVVTDLLMY